MGNYMALDGASAPQERPSRGKLTCLDPKIGFMGRPARCRRCKSCLKVKQLEWQGRMFVEFEKAGPGQTKFLTLTFRPGAGFEKQKSKRYAEFQKFMKRLRSKNDGHNFRYCCVAEQGERASRRWHFHVLLHCSHPLALRAIRKHWKGGISHARIAGQNDGRYVSKYLTKAANNRPSASVSYGVLDQGALIDALRHSHEIISRLHDCFSDTGRLVRPLLCRWGFVPRRLLRFEKPDTGTSVRLPDHHRRVPGRFYTASVEWAKPYFGLWSKRDESIPRSRNTRRVVILPSTVRRYTSEMSAKIGEGVLGGEVPKVGTSPPF